MLDKKNYLKNKIINLVSISTKDRSIFTKLNSNDVYNPTIFYNQKNIDSLFDNNITSKLSTKNDWSKLEKKLENINDIKSFIKFSESNSIFIPKSKINLLTSSFSKNKSSIFEYIKLKFEMLDKKLINLDNLAINREADTGEWCLYLGRYFLVGSLTNKEVVKAPIFFKEVHINLTDASLSGSDENLHINEKLIVHLIKQEKKSATLLKEWNEIIDIKSAIDFLNLHFEFNLKIPNDKIDFINEDVPKIKTLYSKKIVLEDSYIFGFFQPKGGRLKQDLEHIINIGADVFGDKRKTEIFDSHEVILSPKSKWIQISSLNLSQLFALNLSLKSNTIIHGPPGTGKSETISNIIANIIINNKSALMVSEKKAALDVLLARLGPLKDFGMFFQDTKITKDKAIFFKTIQKLGDIYMNYEIENNFFKYSDDSFKNLINEKHKLNEAFEILIKIKEWNIGNFNYNNYLEAKFEIITTKNLELINFYKLNKLSHNSFFSLKNYSLFLKENDLLDEDLSKRNAEKMKEYFTNFEIKLDKLNEFWRPLTKFDLKRLSILEIRKIENAQPNISAFFQEFPKLMFFCSKNIFTFENLDDIYKQMIDFSVSLELNKEILDKVISNNNYFKLNEVLRKAGPLDKKYIISNWIINDEIKIKKIPRKRAPNWNPILILINKLIEIKVDFYGYFQYLENKSFLEPINIFFFVKSFVFEKNLTLFIENNWFELNPVTPVIIYKNNITFEKAQLANKVFEFEDKYINSKNLELIKTYLSTNDSIYKKSILDWDKIVNEVYEKLIINWKLKIDHSKNKEDILEIFRLSNLKRFPKIKTFIKKYFSALLEIFPIWISRPEDVSDIIECKEGIFDYGIFDEASQMFLERAYPILYRTNIKIVAGDDKQLKPSSFFSTRYQEEEDECEEDDEEYKIKYSDLDSLLLRAIVSSWNEMLLNNHYRSASQDLIEFSNKHIYGTSLNVATFNKSFDSKAFQVLDINGFFVDRKNEKEASKAVELIADNLNKYEKILIITFNESQAELITSKILSSKNKEMILKMRQSGVTITNLENVQGNEGDLVILSIAYGRPSNDKKMRNSFGPLNMDGGKNRLNVGITRAKNKMIVLKSFTNKEMSVSETNENAKFFKKFITHCDEMSANLERDKKSLPLEIDFEIAVYNALNTKISLNDGFSLIPKYKIGTKRIDLAIFDINKNKVSLGLELHKWIDDDKNILENFDEQLFIEQRGYKIYNIFEIEWRINKEEIVKKILSLLKLSK